MIGRADSRKHEKLRTVDGTSTQDDLALGRLHPQSRIIVVTHASKGALAEAALRVESTDIEQGWHALFADNPAPPDTVANHTGAKGLAEPPIIGVAPAIANAVADALGRDVTEIPLTQFNATLLSSLGLIGS